MTLDLKAIRAAAESVKAWGNCNKAWLNTDEDEPAAQVGAVCEDGVRSPVTTVDCDQYLNGEDSLPLAKFYAAANPATIIALLDRLGAAEVEVTEQARLLGISAEKELALMSKLEAALAEPAVELVNIDQIASERYKVVPSHDSMFHRWAVVAGDGTQQLYIGREVECQSMTRKFAGAFLDGAYLVSQPANVPLLMDEEVGMLTVFDGLHHVETPILADFIRHIEAAVRQKAGL